MKQITTSDLRIGNWLFYSKSNKFPMQVEVIGKDYIYLNFEGNQGDSLDIESEDIYPIPLTKDFIIKVSDESMFKNTVDIGGYSGIEMRAEHNRDGNFELIPTINCDEYCIGRHICYVHELQNLYYALTGKELEIKREWL